MVAKLSEDVVVANVARRVAELRELRGLTQAELAVKMRVQLRQAQRYESGANLTIVTLTRLANALGVSPGELFTPSKRSKRGRGRPRS